MAATGVAAGSVTARRPAGHRLYYRHDEFGGSKAQRPSRALWGGIAARPRLPLGPTGQAAAAPVTTASPGPADPRRGRAGGAGGAGARPGLRGGGLDRAV